MAALTLTTHRLFLGTFESGAKGGIYTATFNSATGHISEAHLVTHIDSPSFLVQHPKLPILYAIGSRGGNEIVAAYHMDSAHGTLKEINEAPIGNGGHCHLAISADGSMLASAAYNQGYVIALGVNPDGSLGKELWRDQQTGSGPRADRQEGPHAHCAVFDPAGQHILSCDLGSDKVLAYSLKGQIDHVNSVSAGFGPRHITFHPNHKWAYVIHELGGVITVHDYLDGTLTLEQTVDLLEPGFTGVRGAAEVEVDPTGKWVVGSNRIGESSIVSFGIDPNNGHLTSTDRFSTNMTHPRHFTFDPSGHWILTGSMDASQVLVTSFDPATGHFSGTDQIAAMPHPTCVLFAR